MSISYHNFAYVYDKFMDNIPYKEWSQYLIQLLKQYGIESGTLIDLGCGTGTLCKLMEESNYSIIGIDNSIDMLSLASQKLKDNKNITLLQQDMQKLELGKTYDAFYSLCDSLNYLLSPSDILSTFQGVKKHLKNNGIFIFDLKTPYFYQEILGDQVFCDNQKDCSYIWENNFFEEEQINQYDLTIFIRKENTELFERYYEFHEQRAYSITEIVDLLLQSGLEYVTSYDAFTTNPPSNESERIYVIARNRNGE